MVLKPSLLYTGSSPRDAAERRRLRLGLTVTTRSKGEAEEGDDEEDDEVNGEKNESVAKSSVSLTKNVPHMTLCGILSTNANKKHIEVMIIID